jgi:uncharacterized protein YcaQ
VGFLLSDRDLCARADKRQYGYYVLPILHRRSADRPHQPAHGLAEATMLTVEAIYLEPAVKPLVKTGQSGDQARLANWPTFLAAQADRLWRCPCELAKIDFIA